MFLQILLFKHSKRLQSKYKKGKKIIKRGNRELKLTGISGPNLISILDDELEISLIKSGLSVMLTPSNILDQPKSINQ